MLSFLVGEKVQKTNIYLFFVFIVYDQLLEKANC